MIFLRRHRLITVLFALVNLLFMQLAVASYACAGQLQKVSEAAAMAETSMPCAQSMQLGMDDGPPSLCHAHCKADQQSADTHELPSPVAITALPVVFTLPVPVPVFSKVPLQAPHLKRTTAPPVAIRNCCFRI